MKRKTIANKRDRSREVLFGHNNQYTKQEGGRLWEGRGPTKFSINLTDEQANQWDALANFFGRCKADLFRETLHYLVARAAVLEQRYPDVYWAQVPISFILDEQAEKGHLARAQAWMDAHPEDKRPWELKVLQSYEPPAAGQTSAAAPV